MEIGQKIIVLRDNVWSVQETVSKMNPDGSINYLYNGRAETAKTGYWRVTKKEWNEEVIHNLVVENNIFAIYAESHSRKEKLYYQFDNDFTEKFENNFMEDCGCMMCQRAKMRRMRETLR